jgi:predicted lysophospholipase L1 biosynthesis ABC-type transport system permease subunit
VTVVNEAFARTHFRGRSALGERVGLWGRELRIVGVVGDVRFHGLAAGSAPAIHPPLPQLPFSGFRILVGGALPPAAIERQVRAAVAELEPDVALFGVAPLGALVAEGHAQHRFVLSLLAAFGVLAVALAALGVYGVIAFQAAQRRRELGVRQALGAGRRELVRLLAGEGARLAGAGVVLGVAGSVAATRALGSLLYGVSPLDAGALAAAAAVLTVVSLAATWGPARRASRLDPMSVLRDEGA